MRSWRGWTVEHVRTYVIRLIRVNGIRQASQLCDVSVATLSKFAKGQELTLGTIIRIAESMP